MESAVLMSTAILMSGIQVKNVQILEKNNVWFCMTCWEYVEETSAGHMSPILLHNTEQRSLLLMHVMEIKHKCMGVDAVYWNALKRLLQ